MVGSLLVGAVTSTLSTALNFGPEHAVDWLTPAVPPALLLTLILGFGLAWVPRRALAAIGLIALALLVEQINRAGADPYFALSLQAWEQGRFVRFHGLSQWLGWLWPFAAMIFLGIRLTAGLWPASRSARLSTIEP